MRESMKAVPVGIRRATEADWDTILDIWAAAARRAHPFVPGEGRGERRRLVREVLLPAADTYLALRPSGPVGFVSLLPREGHTEIAALYVRPENWREGIGRALLAVAFERLPLRAPAFAANEAGCRFWAANGFAEVDRGIDAATAEPVIVWGREA